MIIEYSSNYYNILTTKITEFDTSYLNKDDAFNKNYVYIIDNQPVGLISYSVIYDRIELNYIWVDKLYRRKKIASKMMEYMCNYKNIKNITLEVSTDNVNAINLYKKYGFNIVSIRKKYYGNKDAYLMMKEVI